MNWTRRLFERAVELVLEHEGGYVDHPDDQGGPTNYGITSTSYPTLDIATLTREEAIAIYWRDYWADQDYDALPDEIAVKVFDLAVNMGKRQAVRCLQRACRSCGVDLDDDGILGPMTIRGASGAGSDRLVVALRSEAGAVYRLIVAVNPNQDVFLDGWLKRAYS